MTELLSETTFRCSKDVLGISAQQWQVWIMPDASKETASIARLSKSAHRSEAVDDCDYLNVMRCRALFHFTLISQQRMLSLWSAKFVVVYLKLLRKLGWHAFRAIDQTGLHAQQLRHCPDNGLAIVKQSVLMGYGVIARYKIQTGVAMTEYLGMVSCDHITSRPGDSTYRMAYPLPRIAGWVWSIDALKEGNISRFVNHSRTPNVEIKIFFDGTLLRLALVALQDIVAGEELTLNYGSDYWLSRNEIV